MPLDPGQRDENTPYTTSVPGFPFPTAGGGDDGSPSRQRPQSQGSPMHALGPVGALADAMNQFAGLTGSTIFSPVWIGPQAALGYNAGQLDLKTYLSGAMDDAPKVYMGRDTLSKAGVQQARWTTVDNAVGQFVLWNDDKRLNAMERMRKAGMSADTFEEAYSSWNDLVNRASAIFAMSGGKREVTPWDVLDMVKKEAVKSGTLEEAQPYTGTKTQIHKNVQEFDEGDIFSTVQSTLSGMLGRAPSDEELRDFLSRANQMAAADPEITKTISRYKNGELVGSKTSSHGGVSSGDIGQMAMEDAQADPDYGAFQASTTYANALLQGIQSVV